MKHELEEDQVIFFNNHYYGKSFKEFFTKKNGKIIKLENVNIDLLDFYNHGIDCSVGNDISFKAYKTII